MRRVRKRRCTNNFLWSELVDFIHENSGFHHHGDIIDLMALNKMEHTHMMLYIRFAGYPNDPTMEPTQPSTIYIYTYIQTHYTQTLHTHIYKYILHILCHVISYHVMSYHVILSHVVSCHICLCIPDGRGIIWQSPLAPAPRLETSPGQQEGQGCQGRRRGRGRAKSSGGCGEVAW